MWAPSRAVFTVARGALVVANWGTGPGTGHSNDWTRPCNGFPSHVQTGLPGRFVWWTDHAMTVRNQRLPKELSDSNFVFTLRSTDGKKPIGGRDNKFPKKLPQTLGILCTKRATLGRKR